MSFPLLSVLIFCIAEQTKLATAAAIEIHRLLALNWRKYHTENDWLQFWKVSTFKFNRTLHTCICFALFWLDCHSSCNNQFNSCMCVLDKVDGMHVIWRRKPHKTEFFSTARITRIFSRILQITKRWIYINWTINKKSEKKSNEYVKWNSSIQLIRSREKNMNSVELFVYSTIAMVKMVVLRFDAVSSAAKEI